MRSASSASSPPDELGAERIIAMSRHADRQALAREFGATDIVEERGDDGVARIKELTDGLGAHSVIEAVGTQESMMQAIRSTRPGGHVGYVGVSHESSSPATSCSSPRSTSTAVPPRYAASCPTSSTASGPARSSPARSSTSSSPWPTPPPATPPWTSVAPSRCCSGHDRPAPTAGTPALEPSNDSQPSAATPQEDDVQTIHIQVGDQLFSATVEDTPAGRDLLAQLPQTIEMSDHGGVEKTGPLASPLSLDGQPDGADPDVGDLGYYAPGNDLVLYYGDQSYYDGIVVLGRLDDQAASRIAQMDGGITVTVTTPDTP